MKEQASADETAFFIFPSYLTESVPSSFLPSRPTVGRRVAVLGRNSIFQRDRETEEDIPTSLAAKANTAVKRRRGERAEVREGSSRAGSREKDLSSPPSFPSPAVHISAHAALNLRARTGNFISTKVEARHE